ncbi:hypothetical protein [Cupriavidus campinensis]|uniref:Uncharacterized protein n=1 Tax=Cupriavidus campinensis TaxID=151783 RepID=A0ABY3ESJ5_9BURK|nr:hypothetical protein [Cupriavidus campinensis]TSP13937.1 hypothetical protein FGG12_05530 [Cupriavidus campinensis]
MKRCSRYAFCEDCVNSEFDQFQCETCDEGSNFEPYESDPDADEGDEMNIGEFKTWWAEAA